MRLWCCRGKWTIRSCLSMRWKGSSTRLKRQGRRLCRWRKMRKRRRKYLTGLTLSLWTCSWSSAKSSKLSNISTKLTNPKSTAEASTCNSLSTKSTSLGTFSKTGLKTAPMYRLTLSYKPTKCSTFSTTLQNYSQWSKSRSRNSMKIRRRLRGKTWPSTSSAFKSKPKIHKASLK